MSEVPWIETRTGRRVNPLHLEPGDIVIKDIAGPLSRICRFSGQCKFMYTVGYHSVNVADTVAKMMQDDNSAKAQITCLAALLHDASEAYTNDIARPVKYYFPPLVEMDKQIISTILKHFHCENADWDVIQKADNIWLATEARYLMWSRGAGWDLPELALTLPVGIIYQDEIVVEAKFMARFEEFGGYKS